MFIIEHLIEQKHKIHLKNKDEFFDWFEEV